VLLVVVDGQQELDDRERTIIHSSDIAGLAQ
jgi:hypothetical protein